MVVFLGFVIQLVGSYLLYSTSAKAVFVKRGHNSYLCKHRRWSKALGCLMLLASFSCFMMQLGIGVGFFFGLASIMTISGLIIILLPLKKS
ncbi:hypothetical protein GCM10007415_42710 [Parapedobacter pyrenivorans]|uniref:Uncharacterized protein n=1 Tax=Parapedobacter pyrenivorans TaxID=1305674 RepID=A0A917I2E5_9SPHI|nr:hypothetical protein [Parapedobacter pyrenivorans]GGH02042.1 hypothetical protein GCM10007415_42710 [Parapedobacter pyrenivorans]